jgi:hypothetical protein
MCNGPWRQVDPMEIGGVFGELLMVRTQTHTDLQDAQPARCLELRELTDERLELVAGPRLGLVAGPIGVGQIQLLATRRAVPEIVDRLLALIHFAVRSISVSAVDEPAAPQFHAHQREDQIGAVHALGAV